MGNGFHIGAYDIGGEGDDTIGDDEIGAAVRHVLARRAKGAPARDGARPTGIKTPYGQDVMERPTRAPDASHYQSLGLSAVTLAVAGPTLLDQQSAEKFIPSRLMLEQTAPGNQVTGLFVGVRPQIANLASLPVSAFAFNAVGAMVSFDTIPRALNFRVNLLTVAAAQTISGMLLGTVVREN